MKKLIFVFVLSIIFSNVLYSQNKGVNSNSPIDIKFATGRIIIFNEEIVKCNDIITNLEKENAESQKVIEAKKKYITRINALIKNIEAENEVFKKRFSPHVEDKLTLERATSMYNSNNENIFKLQTKKSESENIISSEERKIRANNIEIATNKKFISNNQGKINVLNARIAKTKSQKTDVNTHFKKSDDLSNETTKMLNETEK